MRTIIFLMCLGGVVFFAYEPIQLDEPQAQLVYDFFHAILGNENQAVNVFLNKVACLVQVIADDVRCIFFDMLYFSDSY